MIELYIGTRIQARLWEPAEVPSLPGPPATKTSLSANSSETSATRGLAIEVAVPRGGLISYGLLGATFMPSRDVSLNMTVLSGEGGEFAGALASPSDKPLIGLPGEYVPSIVRGFNDALNATVKIPAGTIAFDRCVHGLIGSSPIVFQKLAVCVTRLALGDATPWDTLLQSELNA